MVKFFVSAFLLLSSVSAFAEFQNLRSLSCSGSNGLRLTLDADSNVVTTQLGAFTKKFGVDGSAILYNFNNKSITRIALGLVKAPNVYVYDIYLAGEPTKGRQETLTGVIGHTVYNVVFAPGGGPIPLPIGFVPTTRLNCTLVTE